MIRKSYLVEETERAPVSETYVMDANVFEGLLDELSQRRVGSEDLEDLVDVIESLDEWEFDALLNEISADLVARYFHKNRKSDDDAERGKYSSLELIDALKGSIHRHTPEAKSLIKKLKGDVGYHSNIARKRNRGIELVGRREDMDEMGKIYRKKYQ